MGINTGLFWSIIQTFELVCGSQGNPCSVGMPTSCGNIQNFKGKKKNLSFPTMSSLPQDISSNGQLL
jgi:hypothetical protein